MLEKGKKLERPTTANGNLHPGPMCGFRASDFMLTFAGDVVWCCRQLSRVTEFHVGYRKSTSTTSLLLNKISVRKVQTAVRTKDGSFGI